jgi:hypothetical protein
MWPFRKKNQESIDLSGNVPAEVKEYYQAEKRERAGVAWMLAAATFAVVVAVVLGLFFGGRAVIRHFQGNDDNTATNQTTEQGEDSGDTSQTATPPPNTPAGNTGNTSDQPRQPSSPTPTAPAAPTPTLQNTGPTGDD